MELVIPYCKCKFICNKNERMGNKMKRMTKQRAAILQCLQQAQRPLSLEEILAFAASEIEHLSLSTVFRNMQALIEEAKVHSIKMPGEKSYYEMAQLEHRHYFSCDHCKKIYFINKCPKGLADLVPQGFRVLGHSITLNGLCADCA